MKYNGLSLRESLVLIGRYAKDKLLEQLKSVAFIVLYLAAFQVVILRIPMQQAALISLGIGLAVIGLAFFLEGLMLGLMPLGEFIGTRLPRKAHVAFVLAFACILGMGATFAEPAIGILKTAGSIIDAWASPLLYYVLNEQSDLLLLSVAAGVGIGVAVGILRFVTGWSLKPFVLILTGAFLALWVFVSGDMKLAALAGLAWDTGGVTTGPVTVPLVLSLGIGVSRVMGKGESALSGFGLITFASTLPVLTVLFLGVLLSGRVPDPMPETEFFSPERRAEAVAVVGSEEKLLRYLFLKSDYRGRVSYFGTEADLASFLRRLDAEPELERSVFDGDPSSFRVWLFGRASEAEQRMVFPDTASLRTAMENLPSRNSGAVAKNLRPAFENNFWNSVRAVIPLSGFLILFILVFLRSRLPQVDELVLGIFLSFSGMMLLSTGIEFGLARLGSEVGRNLPAAFTETASQESERLIRNFDRALVNRAVTSSGEVREFFYLEDGDSYESVPFRPEMYDASTRTYRHVTRIEPLFARYRGLFGIAIVLIFAFFMGYGATVAEPALSAMGTTIETITVGIFKRKALIGAVSFGVGLGMILGVARIIWSIPVMTLLVPSYVLIGVFTLFSSEEYVSIAWDSAGVTTGPVTVPLVLAMGLGIGSEVGVTDGFGVLALASAFPILSVLFMGMLMRWKRTRTERMEETP